MPDEIRDRLAREPTPEDLFRAAALSLRSLCEANGWETLTASRPDGQQLEYKAGHGLVLLSVNGEELAFYPEEALEVEQWTVAA